MYSIRTFFPSNEAPEMEMTAKKIYPPQLLPFQQPGDRINTAFAAAGIAVEKNGEPVGRLVLYAATGIAAGGEKTLVIGNYECIDDDEAAAMLLEAAAGFARMEKFRALIGPMNGTTWDTYRFCTSDQGDPFFSEMTHMPWYPAQWEKAGFVTLATYVSTIDRKLVCDGEEILRTEKYFSGNGIRIRNIDLDNYERELKKIFPFCEKAFAGNFLYTPAGWESFREKYLAIKNFILPEAVFISENSSGEITAIAFNFPDHRCTKEKRLVVKTLARDPGKEFRGLGEVLANRTQRFAKENGYDAAIHALMYSDNYSLKLSGQYNGEIFRQYRLYSKTPA